MFEFECFHREMALSVLHTRTPGMHRDVFIGRRANIQRKLLIVAGKIYKIALVVDCIHIS